MISSSIGSGHSGKNSYEMRLPMSTYQGEGTSRGKQFQLNVIVLLIWFLFFKQRFPFPSPNFFKLFQSIYFNTIVTFSDQLFLQNSFFFLLFQNSHFSQEFFQRNNFLFRGKLLPSYNTILRIIGPCYNSCKK